ncbi:hypothetical protein HQ496_11775 [bacterium]|nr:hypothetical protein [bacterium]
MSKRCSHSQDDLILHYYGELEESESAVIEARIVICDGCKAAYDSLVQLENTLPRTPSVSLSDEVLESIRQSTGARVRALSEKKSSSYSLIPGFKRGPQWAMVAASVALAFMVGRSSIEPGVFSDALPLEAPSRISAIDYDAAQGMVQIQYEQSSMGQINGGIHDNEIQTLLGSAILDDENPAGRLRAAQILSASSFLEIQPDQKLIDAFQAVLASERNPGIRLQIVKALQAIFVRIPISEELKAQLFELLISDPNTAVRLEVLDLLTQSERTSIELKAILEAAQSDMNPLIRRRAEEALGGFQTADLLEDIK